MILRALLLDFPSLLRSQSIFGIAFRGRSSLAVSRAINDGPRVIRPNQIAQFFKRNRELSAYFAGQCESRGHWRHDFRVALFDISCGYDRDMRNQVRK